MSDSPVAAAPQTSKQTLLKLDAPPDPRIVKARNACEESMILAPQAPKIGPAVL